jgi:hypothetical protein
MDKKNQRRYLRMKTTNSTINDKKEGATEDAKENVPMKIRKETLNYDKKKPTNVPKWKEGE